MGDVAVVVKTDGLHFDPHEMLGYQETSLWKAKVLLMDTSTAKDEAAFVLREGR